MSLHCPVIRPGFAMVTEAEPGCAMGYWGIAMSHWYPLWFPPSPAALKAGAEAVEKAVAAGPKTERENDYIAAIAAFYRDSDKLDHQTRAVAYEKAMAPARASDRQARQTGRSTAADDPLECASLARTHTTTQPVRLADVPS